MYLGGLSGDDLNQFNQHMAPRDRDRLMPSEQSSPSSGPTRGTALQSREVPFLQAIAAKTLPAGRYPALVRLRGDLPPFLVDMEAQ